MKTITVRLNNEESKSFNEYAKLNNIPLSTLLKKALEEKMEDELDLQSVYDYENSEAEETYTHEEIKEMLGL